MTSTVYLALGVRILIAVCTRTVFQPDEYFQSLEPAHHLVFGYGHLTWEWLNPRPIRSILYPALNVPVYWALKITGIDTWGPFGDWLVIIGPRALHGSFAAATDIWVCEMTRRVIGERYVSTVLLVSITCLFHVLSLSRSLSNSLETSLTTIALSYYPWDASSRLSPQLIYNKPRMRKTLMLAALSCAIRPTNAVIWVYLFVNILWALRSSGRTMLALLSDALIIGSIAMLSLFMIDSIYYRQLTFTPINFLLTNLSSVSLFYGGNPWHYYVSQALPILCTTSLPFVLHGAWSAFFSQAVALRRMLGVVIWTLMVYSLAGHKEWRFVHPLLPILHVLAAKSLVDLSSSRPKSKSKTRTHVPPIRRSFLVILLLSLPASTYIAFLYCSAPISVMSFIRGISREQLRDSVGFLMPCHSTPGHAYLHRKELADGRLWSLGCEPPLENQDLTTYRDQTKVFYTFPLNYLQQNFPRSVDPSFPRSPFPVSIPGAPALNESWAHEWPRHLVFFGALLKEQGVRQLLELRGYREVWAAGRAWEGDQDDRKGGVRVWAWAEA